MKLGTSDGQITPILATTAGNLRQTARPLTKKIAKSFNYTFTMPIMCVKMFA